MPFTISHTAAVILLNRKGLVTSALVIGSMIPDLAYFVFVEGFNRGVGHSIRGFFTFCLPVGMVIFLFFQKFLKQPLFALLPLSQQRRLLPYLQDLPHQSWRFIIKSLGSLGIGTLSHLAWDSFTRKHGFIVQNVAALRQPIFELGGTGILAFSILQHGSTALGLAALVLWYLGWGRKTSVYPYPVPPSLRLSAAMRLIIFSAMAAGLFFLSASIGFLSLPYVLNLHVLRRLAERLAVILVAVLSMEIILYCTIWHLFLYARRESER